ncbi:MAG: SRPBCC domain-containing protein [Actinomycetota bacterium]|nr:SRPBCC domain-containing protein [Actinomycetota bacterium]
MADIRHRVGITAPAGHVYRALATREGLSGWWTREVHGDSETGGKLEFFFGGPEPAAVMEVIDLVPDRRVAWRCVEGPDEWVGTTVTFDLSSSDGETAVLFSHAGWRDAIEFMSHCSTKWAYFLLGLRAGLAGGSATPYPDDQKISSWG